MEHYARVVDALLARGIEPVLTLHHFVSPAWFTERGGWLAADGPERFAAYRPARRRPIGLQGQLVATVNEPTVWAKHAYVTGDWPPCVKGDWRRSFQCLRAMARGHRLAFRHHPCQAAGRDGRPVAQRPVRRCRPIPDRPLDRAAAWMRDYGLNRMFFACSAGRPAAGSTSSASTTTRATSSAGRRAAAAFLLGEDDPGPRDDEPRPLQRHGLGAWPAGMTAILRSYAAARRAVDDHRERHRHRRRRAARRVSERRIWRRMAEAMRDGVPVVGYLHWSLMDNYEWALGFAPRFGLAEVDFATQERKPRAVAWIYAEICRSGVLPA